MAKEKEVNYDEVKEELTSLKGELKEAREALRAFLKENKLKRAEDHSNHKDGKIASSYKKLKGAIEKLEEKKEELTEIMKSRPKKVRDSKYEYPEDIQTAKEKKQYRARMRAIAKRAGVSVDDYLADTEKYDKILEKQDAERKAKREKAKTEKDQKKTSTKKVSAKKPARKTPRVVKKASAEDED